MKYILFIGLLIALFSNGFSQNVGDSNLSILTKNIISNIIAADKLKTFVDIDRNIYTAGETVFFKAFLVDSVHNYIRTQPEKLYVDYVNKNDDVIQRVLLNNSLLQTSGNMVLTDSLHEGFYWMRVYTKEMLNDNNLHNVAIQPFYVIGKNQLHDSIEQNITQPQNNKPIVKIFPEGNSIISGLNSTVALSMNNASGEPLQAEGVVKNDSGLLIDYFKTNKDGRVNFLFSLPGFTGILFM